MNEEFKTLGERLKEKKLSVNQFCRMCDITADPIYKFKSKNFIPMNTTTQKKINVAWMKRYNEPLLPHMYLDLFNN